MKEPILQVKDLSKSFPGVKALDRINLELYEGEVLCIVGENGAGKSTLIKTLSGVYEADSGEIVLYGKPVCFQTPQEALNAGFSVVYQEHKLLPNLTIAENIYFGRMPQKGVIIDYKRLNRMTGEVLAELGMNLQPTALVSHLNSSQSQMVEIAKAYSMGAKIMILDEPSAAITDKELVTLFALINRLKQKGHSFIYISHRLKELYEIGDRVDVFKDGCNAGGGNIADITMDGLIAMMVGREIGKSFKPKDRPVGEEVLRVEHVSNDLVADCSFVVRAGEIVGFSGLVGAGRSELAESIFGYRRKTAGKVFMNGREVNIKTPRDAIRHGMGFITEDRKTTGVILNKSVAMNITLAILKRLSKLGVVNRPQENVLVEESIQKLRIKTSSPAQEAGNLSGGNQQKVILSKWLLTNSKLLICDEPTKGIDVGTKQEFYTILDDLARQGVAVMVISSELPEVIGLSNRVYVMREGRIVKELGEEELSEETIVTYAMKEEEDTAV